MVGVMCRVAFFILFFVFLFFHVHAYQDPVAVRGILDLSSVQWSGGSTVSLNGEWEFYREKLLSPEDFDGNHLRPGYMKVPALWNDNALPAQGYHTYRLRIRLEHHAGPMALLIPNVYTSYKLFVEGKVRAENGKVNKDPETAEPQWRGRVVFLENPHDTTELILQVSNFSHYRGGVHKPFLIGPVEDILREKEILSIADMLLVGGLLVMAASFIIFYLYRPGMKQYLYFGLFCLLWAIRSVFSHIYIMNYLYPDLNWHISLRIEYLTLYLSFLMAILFIHKVFDYTHRLSSAVLIIINFLFVASALVLPTAFFTALLNGFFAFAGAALLNIFYVIVVAIGNKRREAWFSAMGIVIGLIIFVIEFFGYNLIISVNLVYLNLAYLIVFFVNALVLIYGFVKAWQQVDQLESEKSVLYKMMRR